MNTDNLVKFAMNKDLHKILQGPLGGPLSHFLEVFLSDLSVRLGIDAIQWFVKPRTSTDHDAATMGTPPVLASLKLLEVFLTLPRDQRREIAAWFRDIQNNDKQKLGLLSEETQKALLTLSREERSEALSILEDSSIEAFSKVLERIGPEMPKTAEFMQRFGDWGRSVDPLVIDEPDIIRRNIEALIAYIAKLLRKIILSLGTIASINISAIIHLIRGLPRIIQNGFRRITNLTQDTCRYMHVRYVEMRIFFLHIPHACVNWVRNRLRSKNP